jgi:integration host factor subunit beta
MADNKCTKADIIDAVYAQTGLNRAEIRSVYELVFSEIKNALTMGKTVELRGVGTFKLRIREARKKARNPRTGEPVTAQPHRVVSFRPGQEFKLAVWDMPQDGELS